MGKLLIGRYGHLPEAESVTISLKDCHQRLSLKPSDFVSAEEPSFFRRAHKALGKYLVFQIDANEIGDAAVWRTGYYLLPLEAADVLKAFNKKEISLAGDYGERPFEIETLQPPPPAIMARIDRWTKESQPLLFHCRCEVLLLKLDPPSLFRRSWRARLTCRKRCQPAIKNLF